MSKFPPKPAPLNIKYNARARSSKIDAHRAAVERLIGAAARRDDDVGGWSRGMGAPYVVPPSAAARATIIAALTPPAALLPTDSAARKRIPIVTGVLDYFPDAIAEVAQVSFIGNEKHNPGEPLHWSRDKSPDHADCIGRHLLERGTMDPVTNVRHSAQLAWRALAMLQIEIEAARKALPPAEDIPDLN